ncbi:MAG TPA: FAD-dependent oxidoreductase, partial [Gaiellaceae bacterium]|nr:FAD-dependent oxidoreductase [Gaiellaceae bacterium]
MRVVIIGAGVMGCATALELSRRGVRDLVILERAVPGAEASSAAAGMLAAQVESKSAEERAAYVRAREAYATWAGELRELTGVDVGHRRTGALELAASELERGELAARVDEHRREGLRAELVDAAGARAIERELTSAIAGAAWFPDEAQVDPPQLLRALVAATARANVTIRSGTTVSALVVTPPGGGSGGGEAADGARCVGVELDGREEVRGDAVVVAAGSWSSLVPGIPSGAPAVRPVRGQLVMLEERPPRLRSIVFLEGGYVVPRGDGRVICGSTMEDVGHRREVTASGVSAILQSALRIAPSLGAAELSRTWSNFRPYA